MDHIWINPMVGRRALGLAALCVTVFATWQLVVALELRVGALQTVVAAVVAEEAYASDEFTDEFVSWIRASDFAFGVMLAVAFFGGLPLSWLGFLGNRVVPDQVSRAWPTQLRAVIYSCLVFQIGSVVLFSLVAGSLLVFGGREFWLEWQGWYITATVVSGGLALPAWRRLLQRVSA